MSVYIDKETCICCGMCQVACKAKAIRLLNGKAVVDEARCTECLNCICRCFVRAIQAPAKE